MLWSPFIVSTGLEVPSDVSGVPPGPRCLVPVSSNHPRYSGYSGQLLPPCNVRSWGKYSGVWVGSPALVRGKPCYGAQAWSLPHHHAYSFCGLVGMAEGTRQLISSARLLNTSSAEEPFWWTWTWDTKMPTVRALSRRPIHVLVPQTSLFTVLNLLF